MYSNKVTSKTGEILLREDFEEQLKQNLLTNEKAFPAKKVKGTLMYCPFLNAINFIPKDCTYIILQSET